MLSSVQFDESDAPMIMILLRNLIRLDLERVSMEYDFSVF